MRRKRLSKKLQHQIRSQQNDRCFYCWHQFGEVLIIKNKITVLRCEMDHVEPFSFSRNDAVINMVAACQICNRWKSAMLASESEIICHLKKKWADAGIGFRSIPPPPEYDESEWTPKPKPATFIIPKGVKLERYRRNQKTFYYLAESQ